MSNMSQTSSNQNNAATAAPLPKQFTRCEIRNYGNTVVIEADADGTCYSVSGTLFRKGISYGSSMGVGGLPDYTSPALLVVNGLEKMAYVFQLKGYLHQSYIYEKLFGRKAWQAWDNPDVVNITAMVHLVQEIQSGIYDALPAEEVEY